ncbi:hypothetical protein EU546_01725 [Candidatus Thorarchaeota archaeon]|nr:MAG: hypothetical protein EU546_01725 [Candidatus Thorarchaeota archaeon]
MKAKPVFLLNTIVGIIFGIGLMFVPEMLLDFLEVTYLDGGPAMARHTASWILAGALFAFLVRDEEHSSLRQSVFFTYALSYVLMTIVELYGYLMGMTNVLMWGIIGLHVLMGVLFAYLFLTNR